MNRTSETTSQYAHTNTIYRPIFWTLNLFNEVINTCIRLYCNIFDINVYGSLSCIQCHKKQFF